MYKGCALFCKYVWSRSTLFLLTGVSTYFAAPLILCVLGLPERMTICASKRNAYSEHRPVNASRTV